MLRHVTVLLLNGVKMDVVCALDTTGRQLYDFVVSHLSLPEPVFFGLTFLCGELDWCRFCLVGYQIFCWFFLSFWYINVVTKYFSGPGRAV